MHGTRRKLQVTTIDNSSLSLLVPYTYSTFSLTTHYSNLYLNLTLLLLPSVLGSWAWYSTRLHCQADVQIWGSTSASPKYTFLLLL
jgi:hypothetical protein